MNLRTETSKKMNDAYQLLGLTNFASVQDIKNAYRKKARILHPDKQNGNAEEFRRINLAYEKLLKNSRSSYTPGIESFFEFPSMSTMFDLFKKIFPQKKSVSPPMYITLHSSIEEFNRKKLKKIRIKIRGPCDCISTHTTVCKSCHGYGIRVSKTGNIAMCDACHASGQIRVFCGKCDNGVIITPRIFSVPLTPELLQTGSYVFSKAGHQRSIETEPSDIIIRIRVQDPEFCIEQLDLIRNVPISLVDALCGVSVSFKHPSGNMVNVTESNVVYPGYARELCGYGFFWGTGKLILKYVIKFPQQLLKEPKVRENLSEILGNIEDV